MNRRLATQYLEIALADARVAVEPGVGPETRFRAGYADHDIAGLSVGGMPSLQHERTLEAGAPASHEDGLDNTSRFGRKRGWHRDGADATQPV